MEKGKNHTLDSMNSTEQLGKFFVAAAETLLSGMAWGAQKKIADVAKITPSTFNDILKGRRFGSERTRRAIARAFGVSYEQMLKIGANKLARDSVPVVEHCGDKEMFSEARACCIYQFAAEKAGLLMSHFFTDDALKKVRPPGWQEYVNRDIDDNTLYSIALEEMRKLSGIV